MGFERALSALKCGNTIKRECWEDGEYLELVSKINYTNYDGEVVNLEDKIIIVDSTGISTGWIATQEEILAEDWIMAE